MCCYNPEKYLKKKKKNPKPRKKPTNKTNPKTSLAKHLSPLRLQDTSPHFTDKNKFLTTLSSQSWRSFNCIPLCFID